MHRVEMLLVREGSLIARLASPKDVFDLFHKKALTWPQERFLVLHLDVQNNLHSYETVTIGTLDAAVVHPREVFRAAILANSAGILLVHNHPSGNPTPSLRDREVTRQLCEAGTILGIPVRDHVIIGNDSYSSFLDLGLLPSTLP